MRLSRPSVTNFRVVPVLFRAADYHSRPHARTMRKNCEPLRRFFSGQTARLGVIKVRATRTARARISFSRIAVRPPFSLRSCRAHLLCRSKCSTQQRRSLAQHRREGKRKGSANCIDGKVPHTPKLISSSDRAIPSNKLCSTAFSWKLREVSGSLSSPTQSHPSALCSPYPG